MKNNTKVRLHLSKQLFESLTKQVIAEGKVNDGYSEAVKQPKQAKETKAEKAAPEVKATKKMKKMEEVGTATAGSASTAKLGMDMIKKGQAIKTATGLSKQELESIEKILNTIMTKAPEGETAIALQKALAVLQQNTKNVGAGQSKPQTPAMPGKMEEKMSSKEKMAKGLYKETDMEEMGVGSGLSSANIGPGGVVVDDPNWHQNGKAEGSLNEMGAEWEALLTAAGVAGAGVTSYAIMKVQDYLQKKFPEQYKKAQKARSTMGGANPGLDV